MEFPIRVLSVDDDDRDRPGLDPAADRKSRDDDVQDGRHSPGERVGPLDVTTAGSMSAALETLEANAVDCVVARHELPDGTGIDLLRAVRERWGDLPFVLAPRSGSERVATMAVRHGATDYVSGATDYVFGATDYVSGATIGDVSDVETATSDGPDGDGLVDRIVDAVGNRDVTPFDRLPVGAVVWTESLEFDRVNAAAERILGYDRERLIGERWTRIVPDDEIDRVQQTVDRLREGESRVTLVNRNVTATGETVSCEWHHRVVADDSGEVRRVISTFQDVTERIERERRVDELRAQLRELAFTTTKRETARVAVDAAERVMGARLSGVHIRSEDGDRLGPAVMTESGTEAFDTPPSYDRDAPPGTRDAFVWEVFESGEPRRVDDVDDEDRIREESPAGSVIIHPIGDHGVFIVSAPEPKAFTDTDEALAEILARTLTTALNHVDRERKRRERERRLSRLHEATQDLIASETEQEVAERTVTAAEEILEFTITLVRLYDEEAGGLVPVAEGDRVSEYLPPREVFTPDGGSLNWRAYERGEVAVYDDIESTRALDSGTALRSLMILPIGEYGTLSVGEMEPDAFDDTDISLARILATTVETVMAASERKAELRRQRDELEQQNARLERFADVLSHDLRSPLTVAQGRLRLATEECDSEHHAAIERAHDRMEALIDDLLTLAREDDTVTDTEPVELSSFAERCWETVETDAADLRVGTDATIHADPTRLRQLFENLFRNAAEHAAADDRHDEDTTSGADGGNGADDAADAITVTVGGLPDGEGFYVEDDGQGIPAERRSEVFEFGYTDSHGGTGFGLSIVAAIADAHDWSTELSESDAGGARFEFRTESHGSARR